MDRSPLEPQRRLFDAYLMVDWSGSAKPTTGKDSIWWALVRRRGGQLEMTHRGENPDTRHKATHRLADTLARIAEEGDRVIVGFDFPFGYPTGTARHLGLSDPPWRHTWQLLARHLQDASNNRNNRFELANFLNQRISGEAFPFWGTVKNGELACLTSDKPKRKYQAGNLDEWRHCDRKARTTSPVWKLAYPGSVGSQTLTGIPRVWQLRNDRRLEDISRIWPFETGLRHDPEPRIVLAEIYPSIVPLAPEPGAVKDEQQVRTIANHFADLDEQGRLGALFEGDPHLTAAQRNAVETEEAWILGVF